ncbi:Putative gamma-glutamyltranspeptidase, nucleophile aminohydrolase [Septoria linicola]|uniref:Glutathione hydrolase n=1 Tax=Septoria linicola TaxID=215465 RepID=A0A9Q9AYL7_9PEZI|nr:putative gamma-glutamyltranspeptidase, nucleophile aminohydrolase [Septoria linicola]USW57534.1 Putative gamma-glutamyltranspeptidase, nucleophile aminohydrolase [Septoria linicola]
MKFDTLVLPAVLLSSVSQATLTSRHGHYETPNDTIVDTEGNKLGAVASQAKICSEIGGDILKKGGNAADATVGTVLCVGVIGMHHSGIGGGGFLLVRSDNGSYEYIDFRETAPAAAFQDMYNNNTNASLYGGLASGVPGELRGLQHLHENYGVLPWKDLVLPAAKVARDGFPVGKDLVRYMDSAVASAEPVIGNFLVDDPNWAIDFAPNGTRLGLGDIITRKRYAATLETIADQGPDAFYSGPLAKTWINHIQATGGNMTLEDLKNYTVAIRKPASITYRDFNVHSCSAPSSGTVAMSVLKIIEGYKEIGWATTTNESTHIFDEALRFAYGQRSSLGDPSFVEGLAEYEADMLSVETVEAVRAKLDPLRTLNVSDYDPSGFESLETPGTSAVSVADANGMAIALTTTVNLLFGSKVLIPETGIIANNEMNDFSVPGSSNAFGYIPSPANYIRPGKRPLSSITPTIVEHSSNGTLYFVTSAAGGSRILTSTAQNLWNVLDKNATAAESLAAPRLHDQLVPNQVSFEYAYDNATVAYLASLGHNVTWVAPGQSSSQQLRRLSNGTFEAASEPRQLDSAGVAV